jgi:shikimate kinase
LHQLSLASCPVIQFWLHCVRFAGLQLNADSDQHHQSQEQQQQQQQQLGRFMPSIIIIGMRGSGKTTVGLALARSISADFYDCDECLKVLEPAHANASERNNSMQRQLAQGSTLASFIAEKGWDTFRKEETRVLHAILCGDGGQPTLPSAAKEGVTELPHGAPRLVVSTGGGIVETPEVKLDARCVVQLGT